jgi:4-coumarate--CoA ligase
MPRFDLGRFCSNIERYKIAYVYIVSPVILMLSKHPVVDKDNLSCLRIMSSGTAPLTNKLTVAASSRLRVGIKQTYG